MNKGERLNKITETIIGTAINIHRALGPGLLESAYVNAQPQIHADEHR